MKWLSLILMLFTLVSEAETRKSPSRPKKRRVPRIFVTVPGATTFEIQSQSQSTSMGGTTVIPTTPGGRSPQSVPPFSNPAISGGTGTSGLVFNEGASKGQSTSQDGGTMNGGAKPPGKAGGGDGGGAIAFDKFWPLCMFIDESEENGNEAVKGVVDMAAACGVNLVVWPVTTKGNYPNSSGAINSMAQNACNIIDAGIAKAASVTTCVRYPDTAGEMCGDPPEKRPQTAGCAQLGGGGGGGDDKGMQTRMKSSGHFGGKAEAGKAVPSIERSGACTPSVVAHESQGHSQLGWPNGSAAGNGIGTPDEGNAGSGSGMGGANAGAAAGGGWTGVGCAQMRATALPNDGRWKYNPKQEIYYIREKNPDLMWDLTDSSRKLFQDPKAPPKEPPRMLTQGEPPRQKVFTDDFFTKKATPQGETSLAPPVDPDGRHRKRQGPVSVPPAIVSSDSSSGGRTSSASVGVESEAEPKANIPPVGPAGSLGNSSSLVFNDSAAKGGISSAGADRKFSSAIASDESGGGASFSERNPASTTSSGPSASTSTLDSIVSDLGQGRDLKTGGFDDDYLKGIGKRVRKEKRVKGSTLRRPR